MKQKAYGLSTEEVRKRMEQGEGNITAATVTKTYGQIIKENVFTLFNFLNFLIAGLLFAAGAYSNMLFIAIILLNLVIGIAQECKAKKLVDELSLLNRPGVCVMRDGREQKIETIRWSGETGFFWKAAARSAATLQSGRAAWR